VTGGTRFLLKKKAAKKTDLPAAFLMRHCCKQGRGTIIYWKVLFLLSLLVSPRASGFFVFWGGVSHRASLSMQFRVSANGM
jgi:hypothetical protein